MTAPTFSPDELLRYARHLTLPEVGLAGQGRLKNTRVLLIGAGGLGSPAALYLAAAGVGTLGIVDGDTVDASNLQRQVLHDTTAIGTPKTESAARRIAELNPHVVVEQYPERITTANGRELVRALRHRGRWQRQFSRPDTWSTMPACSKRRPLVYGSIFRFSGQLSLFGTPGGPCYRCVFAEPPPPELVPSCAEAGVLGVLPGLVGSMQALETIKWILGIGKSAAGRLLLIDALALQVREIAVRRDPACPVCGDQPSIHELVDYDEFCGVPRDFDGGDIEITARQLAEALRSPQPPVIVDVREEWEYRIGAVPGAQLVPLPDLPARLGDLPTDRELITVCHHGQRSLVARALLVRAGFSQVRSLAGGVDAWAESVDPTMARY